MILPPCFPPILTRGQLLLLQVLPVVCLRNSERVVQVQYLVTELNTEALSSQANRNQESLFGGRNGERTVKINSAQCGVPGSGCLYPASSISFPVWIWTMVGYVLPCRSFLSEFLVSIGAWSCAARAIPAMALKSWQTAADTVVGLPFNRENGVHTLPMNALLYLWLELLSHEWKKMIIANLYAFWKYCSVGHKM